MGKLLLPRRSLLAAPAILLFPRTLWAAGHSHGTALNDLPTGSSPTQPPPQGAASIQYPTLFTAGWTKLDGSTGAYATRPGWRVPGVDYYVGIDRVTYPSLPGSLTDPTAGGNGPIAGVTGASYNTTNQIISVTGSSNSTFEGYNFDYSVIHEIDPAMSGGATLTFSNCRFVNGANCSVNAMVDAVSSTGNISFINCNIDMGNSTGFAPTDFIRQETGIGSTTFKYCSILNIPQGSFSSTAGGPISYLYSYFNGLNFASNAHGEWLKLNFNSTTLPTASVTVSFCTFIMPFTDGGGITAPIYPSPLNHGAVWSCQIDHNVFINQPFQFTGGISNGAASAGTLLNITAMSGGSAGTQVGVGFSITGPGVTAGTTVSAVDGTGTGGTGTYHVNNSQLVAAGTTLTSNTTRGVTASNSGGAIFPTGPLYVFANYVDTSGSSSPNASFIVTAPTTFIQSLYGNINLVDGSAAT